MSNLDNNHTDDKADQPRLVAYPSPDGSEENTPLVQFPSPNEMDEESFHRHAAEAFPQLLQEFVGKKYPMEKDHGYIDILVKHILEGNSEQAEHYARAWQSVRGRK
jgi:hypothetical protein